MKNQKINSSIISGGGDKGLPERAYSVRAGVGQLINLFIF